MNQQSTFDSKIILSDLNLTARESSLLGFEERFIRINEQLRLLLNIADLATWSNNFHKTNIDSFREKMMCCKLLAYYTYWKLIY